jgi:hypothetical protein
VPLTGALQDAKDTKEEAVVLKRLRVQMFLLHCSLCDGVSAAAGHPGAGLAPVPEDHGAFLLFFEKLTEKLLDAVGRLIEFINTECWELLGLLGARIFTNLQRQCPKLDLLNVLRKVQEVPATGTPDHEAAARAAQVSSAIQRLLAIYKRPGA